MKVKCAFCKSYIPREDALRIGVQSFCSHDHYVQSRASVKKNINNIISQDDRLKIIEADGFACRFCGRENYLHVHHIRYRSEGGSDDSSNLITLCGQHHDVVHSNKKRFQPLCLKLVELREEFLVKDLKILDLEKLIEEGSLEEWVSLNH
jgi:5-methylcytosine-specific restriction endonuclease McrA